MKAPDASTKPGRLPPVPWTALLAIVGGVLLLNLLLTVFLWYPEYEFHRIIVPSAETAAVLLLLLGLSFADRRKSRWVLLGLSPLLFVVVLYGFGEALKQHAFRRPFVPWTDLEFIPALFNMVFQTAAFARTPVLIGGGIVLLAAGAGLIYLLLRLVEGGIRRAGVIYTGGAAAFFVVLGAVVGFGPPLTGVMIRQVHAPPAVEEQLLLEAADAAEGSAQPREIEAAPDPAALPGLAGRDVFIFIVESYGHTLFSNPRHYALIAERLGEVERDLGRAGFAAASRFLDSPTFGGTSWLADATLLTGVRIDTQHKYNTVFRSGIENMTQLFEAAGYRSIMSAPGTRQADEEWKSFYRFDEYYFLTDFGYQGPYFCFGVMPDQYQINRIRRSALARDTGEPVFVEFFLVSSHTPFNFIPPYIESWDSIEDGSEYHAMPKEIYRNNWLTGGEYPEGYTASVRYVLTVVSRFLIQYAAEDALAFIVGDHQPKFPVSEKDATFSVPMHVLSRDHGIIEAFRFYGYTDGLHPEDRLPHAGLETFYPMFRDIAMARIPDREVISAFSR